jgi:hypothetical protein
VQPWKKTFIKVLSIWGVAAAGSVVGSVVVGLWGVLATLNAYPHTYEYQAAFVGAGFGSMFSIPIGFFVGSLAGTLIAQLFLRRNWSRLLLAAGASAFVIGAVVSGVSLIPLGFFFFALGHI